MNRGPPTKLVGSAWILVVLLGCALAVAGGAVSRAGTLSATDGDAQPAEKLRATNLRVLSKDMPQAELDALMQRYNQALGVSCGYCHTRSAATHRWDYASDDNPAKQTARVMIAMVEEINAKYLSQLGDTRYRALITCGNCHQGQSDPPTFDALDSDTAP